MFKRVLRYLVILFLAVTIPFPGYSIPPQPIIPSSDGLPVFPGAQGFGTRTPAGRGGEIIKVTNWNDSGPGSLRAAIAEKNGRIVVFEVGGTIELAKPLKIENPFLTIAGQTAPSPGITLKGAGIIIRTHDVLLQHLRIRVGDALEGPLPEDRDGLKILGNFSEVFNVVCDHLTISWAIDENVSTWYGIHDVTISNSIISEGLYKSVHPQGPHSKAFLVGTGTKKLSLVGNLFAHNQDRNPRITGDSSVAAVNNVFYNGGSWQWFDIDKSHHTQKPTIVSVIGNVFIEGSNTPRYAWPIKISKNCAPGTKVFQANNLAPGDVIKSETIFKSQVSYPPVWDPSLRPLPARMVESHVLSNAGARPVERDSVDKRIVREVKIRGGAIVDSVGEVGGWPKLRKTKRPFNLPLHPHGDQDNDGYTNIEEVLHHMANEVEDRFL